MEEEDNAVELLQRYRRDRRILLDFILSGSLIKKVVMPPGAVSLDDVDLDQVSVEYVLGCVKKGGMLELSEAIRDYHDSTLFPHMINNMGSTDEFFLVTNSESSGSPPKRAPPSAPLFTPSPIMPSLLKSQSLSSTHVEESLDSMHVEESLNSTQVQELSVDDIDDFEDDDDLEEVDSRRTSRRIPNDASDLALGLPSFATGKMAMNVYSDIKMIMNVYSHFKALGLHSLTSRLMPNLCHSDVMLWSFESDGNMFILLSVVTVDN
ncbi:protein unc-13 homolog [Camellia sinensis]|uniref:protein unc-13 homolog n=1 Tax=Camellia sinensis TaxID=4442 RepID=UPI0010368596|nr:protein unc-13 homolog [Camellia sinensis]XP_028064021.1 protein unc-13 homolog [Camellia sinensis]